MTELLKVENLLIKAFSNYVQQMEQKLKNMQKILNDLKYEHSQAEIDPEDYLGNPLRSFSLIRRLHSDWLLHQLYLSPDVPDFYQTISNYISLMPDEKDLKDATNGVQRLQSTFDMKVEDMAMGLLNGFWYNSNLTALDAYTIGKELFKQDRCSEAIPWLNLSLNIPYDCKLYEKVYLLEKKEIYIAYIKVLLEENLFNEAFEMIRKALILYPNDDEFFELLHDLYLQRKEGIDEKIKIESPTTNISTYKHLCRGLHKKQIPNKLYCHYYAEKYAFTLLAPFKREVLSFKPYIALYHDVITDKEILELKTKAAVSLKTAQKFGDKETFSLVVRAAKTTWYNESETKIVKSINQRLIDITGGFYLSLLERLQIINYGLGGHYDAHYDAFGQYSETVLNHDRRASILVYLSDVEQGGQTVFPKLDIAVKPQKGQALLWFNIDNNGNYNSETLHAACPVLVGSKWVMTKWIHEQNQFRLGFGPRIRKPYQCQTNYRPNDITSSSNCFE